MFASISRFVKDTKARFVEDALYIAGAVIVVIAAVFKLGPAVSNVFNKVVSALPH